MWGPEGTLDLPPPALKAGKLSAIIRYRDNKQYMKKTIFGSLFAVALLLVGAGTASAATLSNVTFANGDVTVSGTGGTTVNATFKLTVGAGETVEYIRTTAGSQPFKDTSVGGSLGLQEGTYDVTVQVQLPPNTGYYNLDVQSAGIFGAVRAINGADGSNGGNSFGNALRVVATGNTGTSTGDSFKDQFCDAFPTFPGCGSAPTTPAPAAVCTELSLKLAGTSYGVYNDANVSLQGFLLASNPNSIPALKAGSTVPMGFYGPQTAAALAAFKVAKSCN